ncbi:MAG: prepilin-type N-terminal cleavage/methylation domain-containing protein [Terriglobia bacterium]
MKKTAENGFSLIELLIVVAIILIIAAIAIPNLLESRIAAHQAAAVSDLRGITTSNLTYLTMYNEGYATSLAVMGPPASGSVPTSTAAGLINSDLAAGFRDGYTFTYNPSAQDSQGRYQSFTLNANPSKAGVTGNNYYYSDSSFVIHMNTATTASASDSPIQ